MPVIMTGDPDDDGDDDEKTLAIYLTQTNRCNAHWRPVQQCLRLKLILTVFLKPYFLTLILRPYFWKCISKKLFTGRWLFESPLLSARRPNTSPPSSRQSYLVSHHRHHHHHHLRHHHLYRAQATFVITKIEVCNYKLAQQVRNCPGKND